MDQLLWQIQTKRNESGFSIIAQTVGSMGKKTVQAL
jgi:hypothetical protein